LSSNQDSLGFLLTTVARQLRHAFQQRLTDPQLTLAQARALVYVARHEGVRQVELAALLEVQPITLARLIDQLARAGLVERRVDPGDRRAYRIHLCAAAGPQLDTIFRTSAAVQADALRGLAPAQVKLVFDALHRMRDNLGAP